MEDLKHLCSNEKKRLRGLTPLRACRGLMCILVLLSTAFIMLVYFGFVSAVMLRLFSIRYSRKATSFFFGAWLALWPFLFEKINKTTVVFSGETVPARERVLLIANHRTEVDWMYLWDLALRKGCLGYIKYVLKSTLMKLPVFGWGFSILEFIPVERKWKVDESTIRQMLSTFKDPRDPLWLALFPEGTDFTDQKCIRSQKHAAERGLPLLKNVLLPKTKGFCTCLEELRGSLDAGYLICVFYDVTIAYKHRCPSFLDNVFGVDPSEVHIHVQRIPLDDIPTSEDKISSWLMDKFCLKDQLLSNFYIQGHFPCQGTEGELSTVKCLVNIVAIIVLTSICAFFTLFSSIWFKMYVSLACAYFATATYFNIRPLPIFGLVNL
ncbi:probable 1-acyl-sn-glycerol-3-phosphate acyltransferase 5 isoform X1 [Alnus glutinosa]|uniref:probable 1-acyl-sn-glycerol-3-phosphate acyltransferase 5 isoform X1 n=1 Tax=Alnus glutinosa TaxID=3517 RepID=UPI002D78A2AC|nr:probable 1-acyl-sn-glycerol-3-phosphate acyltransferase 5 isoform X1 [Alnus glutinosa]XP_062176561.1 probable 1-acyl-sn-glycerol-3-phosphate acyltransferase 5 isoform X1 [Alnus glutinosa]XP_062176562.1 probable 1-acyl-sn-glycerol-3-phosphate acyltransferase 5 isoform X1 [Alnus glutinosa]XP_062176563.1 probable 1-acyl-sn-glycerol-3-phosphate acyltransferase 5 isoform X1 [Alnus glutinosa]